MQNLITNFLSLNNKNSVYSLFSLGAIMKRTILFILAAIAIFSTNMIAQTTDIYKYKYEDKVNENNLLIKELKILSRQKDSLRQSHSAYKIKVEKELDIRSIIDDSPLLNQGKKITKSMEDQTEVLARVSSTRLLEIEFTKGIICYNDNFGNQMSLNFRHGLIKEDHYSILINSGLNLNSSKVTGTTIPGFSVGINSDLFNNGNSNIVPIFGGSVEYSFLYVSDILNQIHISGVDQGVTLSGRFGVDLLKYRLGFLSQLSWRASIDNSCNGSYNPFNALKFSLGGKFIL